jgi:hypothetical protein
MIGDAEPERVKFLLSISCSDCHALIIFDDKIISSIRNDMVSLLIENIKFY